MAKPPSRRNPCRDARRTETCVAPGHVGASRDFDFSPINTINKSSAGGGWGGGALPDYDFLCFIFFPVQQTTSGIGHRVK